MLLLSWRRLRCRRSTEQLWAHRRRAFVNNRGKFVNLNRGSTSGELIAGRRGITPHLREQKEWFKKRNHLSSKDKAVSCCEGLVNIHHCEKPLVKLSEHGSRRPTLITAGIWKLWLQLRQNKICIANFVQVTGPEWKSCLIAGQNVPTAEDGEGVLLKFSKGPTDQLAAAPGRLWCVSQRQL